MRVEIHITDHATPELRAVLAQVKPGGPIYTVMGRALANVLKTHFRARNADSPNKLGGKRTNFWSRVAQGVQNPVVDSSGVTVTISHPAIRQKYQGGTIKPTGGKKFLTIPVAPQAYGRTAGTFQDLVFLRVGPKKTPVLAKPEKNKAERLTIFYLLVRSVTQAADPRTLPAPEKMLEEVTRAARAALSGLGKNA